MILDVTTSERQSESVVVLDAALGRLADVLAGAEASVDDCCGRCYTEADAVALAGPLDGVPAELFPSVAAKGADHWDDFANLYRKLTPRVMEMLVHGDLYVDEQLIADRFAAAGCWDTWAADERDAMLAVCCAWWEATLNSHPSRPDAREVLSFLATTPVPLAQWLEVWSSQPPGPADLHAMDLWRWWAPDLFGGELTLGWSSTIDITAELKRWILEDARPRIARVTADPDLIEGLALLESGD